MKAVAIIILISILSVVSSEDIESKDETSVINYHGFYEKISGSYDQVKEQITLIYTNFIDRFFKPPNYDFEILNAVKLKDCIDSLDIKQPCLLVNLNIKNAHKDSISFELTGRTIVTKDGKQLEKYGGLYNTKQLNVLCDTTNFFKLFPNATTKVGICFPIVNKEENPILYVGVTANGKQKEHSFDLTSYILQ